MAQCRGCGAPLVTKSARVYCSNSCQQAVRRSAMLSRWLETGVGALNSAPGHYIREYLREQQGGRCAICDGGAEWNGLPLDHVDGDASNNRRDNLRLICPNCDSQLPTYKARNRGRGRAWRRERYADGRSY